MAISTMGRGFWVLDNISTLRQDVAAIGGDDLALFKPKDTVRYRQPRAMPRSQDALPDYPVPSVIIDYYLPNDSDVPITLEILNASGELVNSFKSKMADVAPKDKEPSQTDMATNQTFYVTDESLSSKHGLHRFHWRMNHFGPWHENANRRYKNGQMAMPGTYTVRLTAGDKVQQQTFVLQVDPKVTAAGLTMKDLQAQTDFGLKVTALVSDVRQYVDDLQQQDKALADKSDEGSVAKRAAIERALQDVNAADQIYPMPMLLEQVQYLSYQINNADQKPGGDALKQYAALKSAFDTLRRKD